MDDGFVFDLDEVIENIKTKEILSFCFPTFRKALVLDTRSNETEGPMVRVMSMVSSPQERIRSLSELRLGFPRVRNITVVPWPRYVESMGSLGIWSVIVARLTQSGMESAGKELNLVFQELRQLEKTEMAAMVAGQNYHTIWSARG